MGGSINRDGWFILKIEHAGTIESWNMLEHVGKIVGTCWKHFMGNHQYILNGPFSAIRNLFFHGWNCTNPLFHESSVVPRLGKKKRLSSLSLNSSGSGRGTCVRLFF